MKTKKIVWRLKDAPTAESLRELVKDKILTKNEAREILFSQEEVEDRDKKSLQEEIKFLRALVEKLSSSNRTTIIETIREVEKPWRKQPWIYPYDVWCTVDNSTGATYTLSNSATGSSTVAMNYSVNADFSDIKTF